MAKHGSYLVCKKHIGEVEKFLGQFFEKVEDRYTHDEWITFKVPGSNFLVNLMNGDDQEMTKNITFEIYCDSLDELQKLAQKYSAQIKSFVSTKSATQYRYHYIEIVGPEDICKIEANYTENIL